MRREIARTVQNETEIPGLKQWLDSMVRDGLRGGPVMVVLTRERRNKDQNAKFHPMISDIHKQCFPDRDSEAVKAVLVQQFANEKEQQGEPLKHPGRVTWCWKTGQPVYVRPSTTDFRKHEASEFIEFLYSEGSELGVKWSEKSKEKIAENRREQ